MRSNVLRTLLILSSATLLGCSEQDNDKIKELSQLQGEAQAQAVLERDREAAKLMEQDLDRMHDFFEANSGHFEGWITDAGTKYKIRISLFPNRARYRGTRLRSQEEVQTEITSVSLNAQITQWNPQVPAASTGCKVADLRPDLADGKLNIISGSCPASYFLILNGTTISGTARPTGQPIIYDLQADRIQEE